MAYPRGSAHRGWATTSTRAERPSSTTTFIARSSAGRSVRVYSTSPSAYRPNPRATVAKSTGISGSPTIARQLVQCSRLGGFNSFQELAVLQRRARMPVAPPPRQFQFLSGISGSPTTLMDGRLWLNPVPFQFLSGISGSPTLRALASVGIVDQTFQFLSGISGSPTGGVMISDEARELLFQFLSGISGSPTWQLGRCNRGSCVVSIPFRN